MNITVDELMHMFNEYVQVRIISKHHNYSRREIASYFYDDDCEVQECEIDVITGLVNVYID